MASSVCHIISLRKNESSLSSNQSNLILALLVCSITDTIRGFISSLAAADYLNMTRGVQQESSCSWTLYTDELNVF